MTPKPHSAARFSGSDDTTALYSSAGERKYLNADERRRLLAVLPTLSRRHALFIETLFWTGARLSEVLALRPADFQMPEGVVVIRTLKRRRVAFREIPLPRNLIAALERHFDHGQETDREDAELIWPVARVTGWRHVGHAMRLANVTGVAASPKGLRHGFAIAALQSGVPLNLVQRWLGHSRMSTTAIYANASGAEEREFAKQFWRMNSIATF